MATTVPSNIVEATVTFTTMLVFGDTALSIELKAVILGGGCGAVGILVGILVGVKVGDAEGALGLAEGVSVLGFAVEMGDVSGNDGLGVGL